MNDVLTVGSLFAGIGGFDLGLERAGMRTVWFCEQDDYCQRVLAKHWPGVPCHPDVRTLVADTGRERGAAWRESRNVAAEDARAKGEARQRERPRDAAYDGSAVGADVEDGAGSFVSVPVPYVDVLVGGFPCQDISLAGAGAGIEGSRSGLWREFARLIRELRPRYVIAENVPALTSRGLDRVLADLAACGFDAEWDHLPASAFGAPHRRDRIWIVAYPQSARLEGLRGDAGQPQVFEPRNGRALADPNRRGQQEQRQPEPRRPLVKPERTDWWRTEPDVGRVAHGIPSRVDRLKCLGNALVPQIAEWIGRGILEYEAR